MSWRRALQLLAVLLVSLIGLSISSAAGAVDNPEYTAPPPVSVQTNSVPRPVQKMSSSAAVPARTSMPITGSDVTQLAVVGLVLVAGGAVVLTVRRRNVA